MTKAEAADILEEMKVLDDTMYAYDEIYLEALNIAIDNLKGKKRTKRMTVFEKIVDHYGYKSQKDKAVEELSELIRAISRENKENIIEEIADVMIMIEQLKVMWEIDSDDIWDMIHAKVNRTLGNIYYDECDIGFEEVE